jgi:hypothetical protein
MPLVDHPAGDYRFQPGIAPYSCGVVSKPGFEIVHVMLHRPVPYLDGFERIRKHLSKNGRPLGALCAIELRSPRPFTFEGFAEFNRGYADVLKEWGVFVNGVNPVARTNVAPEVAAPSGTSLYGFSYTRACVESLPQTFVVAGAGELPEGVLSADGIVRAGDVSPDAIAEKSRFVLDLMESRLLGLGGSWDRVTAIDLYTVHPIRSFLPDLLKRVGDAATHGIRWFYSRPPIEGIEFEMDLRGVLTELRV